MLNVGMTELLCFAIIALLVLGPDKLPEAARFVAKWYGKAKRMITSIQTEIDQSLKLSEFRAEMQKEIERITEIEQRIQLKIDLLNQQHQSKHSLSNSDIQVTDSTTNTTLAHIESGSSPKLGVIHSLHQLNYEFLEIQNTHYKSIPFKKAFIRVQQQLSPTLANPLANNKSNPMKIAV